MDRYTNETRRLYGVLDKRLDGRDFIAGDYSIADMAAYPWIAPHAKQKMDLVDFPNVARWFDAISQRPATARAYALGPQVNPALGEPLTEEQRRHMFGPPPR